MIGGETMSLWLRVRTPECEIVLEFPATASREQFEEEMERIEAAGEDPGLQWEDLCSRYGGRVVAVVEP